MKRGRGRRDPMKSVKPRVRKIASPLLPETAKTMTIIRTRQTRFRHAFTVGAKLQQSTDPMPTRRQLGDNATY